MNPVTEPEFYQNRRILSQPLDSTGARRKQSTAAFAAVDPAESADPPPSPRGGGSPVGFHGRAQLPRPQSTRNASRFPNLTGFEKIWWKLRSTALIPDVRCLRMDSPHAHKSSVSQSRIQTQRRAGAESTSSQARKRRKRNDSSKPLSKTCRSRSPGQS